MIDQLLDATVLFSFDRTGFARHARRFGPMPRLDGRHVVVTGGNAGIGRAIAEGCLSQGARVTIVCRDRARGEAAAAELGATLVIGDMGDLDAVDRLAGEIAGPVDALVHNAGALVDRRTFSPQGHELTLAVHVLGPWRLTERLADRIPSGGRVIFVASGGMYAVPLIPLGEIGGKEPFDGVTAYAHAKRAQVVGAGILAEQRPGWRVAVMHPGWADTGGVRTSLPGFFRLTRSILRTAAQGADTAIWLCGAEFDGSGRLWFDREIARDTWWPSTRTSPEARARLGAELSTLALAEVASG